MSHDDSRRADDDAEATGNETASVGRTRDRRSTTLVTLLRLVAIFLFFIAAAVLLKLFFAERIPELTIERLEAAEQLWQQKGPDSYDLEVEIRGARPGSARVEVRDGAVTVATRDGRQLPSWTRDTWSVPGQFDTLQRELELAEDPQHEMMAAPGTQLQLRCDFDPRFGFPRRFHRFATGGAPEVFWRVSSFRKVIR
jgi:hypothetical protein